jgi:hypothetical protein
MRISSTKPFVGQAFGPVGMTLRATSNHEKPLWGSPSGLPPAFRPARNFTSAGSTGDLVAGVRPPRGFAQARGRFFDGAAGLLPGAEPYVSGSAGDLVAGDFPKKAAA